MIDPSQCRRWERSLAATQQQFADDLMSAGFSATAERGIFEGEIEIVSLAGRIETGELRIEIGDDFPYRPPKVTDTSLISAHTWHHDRDWGLCLYGRRDVADRPWQDVDELLLRVRQWFQNAADGWPQDPPDLDLERYFENESRLVIYDDIESLMGGPFSARRLRHDVLRVDRAWHIPPRKRSRRDRHWGWAGDIGELEAPVFDWPSVRARLGEEGDAVADGIRNGSYELILLRYHRKSHTGVIALFPQVSGRTIHLVARAAAGDDRRTRRLRAGEPRTVASLGRRSVAIVGVGAVGSCLAELLARAGIGRLHLVDPQLLRPGNCVRHIAGYDRIGQAKVDAVRNLLACRELMDSSSVEAIRDELGPELGADLIARADVVVDATADDNVRSLLTHLWKEAESGGIQTGVVSVAVHRSGGIVRTDRWPRDGDGAPDPIPGHPDGEQDLREGGCGEPVSATPASAVFEAAGLASRVVIDLLTGAESLPASVVQILVPQPDAPYQELGILTR